jgi:hypothetical protein
LCRWDFEHSHEGEAIGLALDGADEDEAGLDAG